MIKPDGVYINDELQDPTSKFVKNYMFGLLKETPFLDYKKKINVAKGSDFPKFVKDALAFANYGGGYIFLGMEENSYLDPEIKGKFIPIGLVQNFHIDQATLQEKTNSYTSSALEIDYDEFYKTVDDEQRKFAIIYIKPSKEIVVGIKDELYKADGKTKYAFKKNTVYTRRGTQSIPASPLERDWIEERIKNENYRISILSGEPDEITELLYANLFEIKKFPQNIYFGSLKFFNHQEIIEELKKYNRYPFEDFRIYENNLVTLQNITDFNNTYRNLIEPSSIYAESVNTWLNDKDKKLILISLLNKSIINKALHEGMWYDRKTNKLFFSSDNQKRVISWPSKFRAAQRTVANQIYASQLKSKIFFHPAINTSFIEIRNKFFLQINPTFIITKNGRQVVSGLKEGTIITKLSYNKYNDTHLNNVLFWSNKLGNGDDILINSDFIISSEPISVSAEYGISWDVPTTELKHMIENYKPETDPEVSMEKNNGEFTL